MKPTKINLCTKNKGIKQDIIVKVKKRRKRGKATRKKMKRRQRKENYR
jgi:hypothetical protein